MLIVQVWLHFLGDSGEHFKKLSMYFSIWILSPLKKGSSPSFEQIWLNCLNPEMPEMLCATKFI